MIIQTLIYFRYGLILSDKKGGTKKAPPAFSATRNVFGDDSGSDDEANSMNAPVRQGEKIKRQVYIFRSTFGCAY